MSQCSEVVLLMGRQHLLIRGIVVATEGDLCRDPALPRKWTPEMLRRVRDLLNNDGWVSDMDDDLAAERETTEPETP